MTTPPKSNWTKADDAATREGVAVNFLQNLSAVRRRRRVITLPKKRNRR